ncbi:hypothetical protein [Sinimarinibacterium sp. NLF-5-8]|uniref:hypothetical protein n=1 Tax=Sinimarinibacterium sp. NLF-5-8 TaxID=2698684 RepID=UPI00137B9AF9|nr:hypothetical protein [Sinimarinibacterium sp. NLF-5-8]QHS08774.1 hypothetical protein GT972_00555 [Sinimarinibacterium sp. NLF-5-8]
MTRALLPLLLLSCTARAQEPAPPLDASQLQVCAEQVQRLQQESPVLLAQSQQSQIKLQGLLQRRRALNDAAGGGDESLQAYLTPQQQRAQLDRDIGAFNHQVDDLRARIAALDALKRDYDQRCAGRSYRRSDFAQLSDARQAAMRAGLAQVRVPYLGGDARLE